MGARKGQNNFRQHQKKAVDQGLKRITDALRRLPRGNRFDGFHSLVRAAAEAAGMHPTTISRNMRYRRAVWDHIQSNPAILVKAPSEVAPAAALQAGKLASDIEAAGLKRENNRLRKFADRLMAQASEAPSLPPPDAGGVDGEQRWKRNFVETATVLARLLDRLAEKELGIVSNPNSGEIVDTVEVGSERVIAGRPHTTAFFEWLAAHERHLRGISPERKEQ